MVSTENWTEKQIQALERVVKDGNYVVFYQGAHVYALIKQYPDVPHYLWYGPFQALRTGGCISLCKVKPEELNIFRLEKANLEEV